MAGSLTGDWHLLEDHGCVYHIEESEAASERSIRLVTKLNNILSAVVKLNDLGQVIAQPGVVSTRMRPSALEPPEIHFIEHLKSVRLSNSKLALVSEEETRYYVRDDIEATTEPRQVAHAPADAPAVIGRFVEDISNTVGDNLTEAVRGSDATRIIFMTAPRNANPRECYAMLPELPLKVGETTRVRFVVLAGSHLGFDFGLSSQDVIVRPSSGVFIKHQGDLHDGLSDLKVAWTDERIKDGDPVDWYIEAARDELRIYISTHNRSYGLSFHIPDLSMHIQSAPKEVGATAIGPPTLRLRPTILFTPGAEDMMAAVAYWNPVPTVEDAAYRVPEADPLLGLRGAWQDEDDPRIVYHLKGKGRGQKPAIRLMLKMRNMMETSFMLTPDFQVANQSAILHREMEEYPSEDEEIWFMSRLSRVYLDGDTLVMETADRTRRCRRHLAYGDAVEANPFVEIME